MRLRFDLLAVSALAALTLAFCWKLALTNLIMVGVDIFTYFYPYRDAINEALARGQLPLWNPYLFMGVPLLANGQAGFFYPLNWLFVGLTAPQAINDSIVLHVFLAAAFCYLFARDALGLTPLGALVAACVFAFSGYVGSLVEHVNQLQAAAWFPLMLWCVERARFSNRAWFVWLGGLVFALQLLAGHTQVSYISLVGLGLWWVGGWNLEVGRWKLDIGCWKTVARSLTSNVHYPISIVCIGFGLAAIQLLPMLELSRLSIRGGGMTYREAVAFSLPPTKLLQSFLPTYGLGEPVFSEYIAFVGVIAFVLALVGVWRHGRSQVGLLLLLVAGFTLALGVLNPLYFVLYKLAPGFGLFRVPARWLFLYAFAMAGFAGMGGQAIGEQVRLLTAEAQRRGEKNKTLRLRIFSLCRRRMPSWRANARGTGLAVQTVQLALLLLTLLELFVATRWLPYNQPTAPEAFSSLRPAVAYLLSEGNAQPFRILSYSDLNWDPGDLADIRAMFAGQLSPEAIYQYIVAAKSKEIVAPNLAMRYHLQSVDGYDGGILPLARFVGLQRLFLSDEQVNPDGRLRERLRAAPPVRWLDLFNVRYLIADKIFDVWVDGIYYDLGLGLELQANDRQAHLIDAPSDFDATGIGVVSYLRGGAAVPNDTPVAELLATDTLGKVHKFILRAGRETAEGEYDTERASHDKARAVHTLREHPNANEYHALFTFDAPTRLASLSVRALKSAGMFALRGLTLVDQRSTTGKPLTFAPEGKFRLVHSGDIKIYEYLDVSQRAVVVHRADVQPDDALALALMSAVTFDPRAQIVVADGKAMRADVPATVATITAYDAERITLQTNDPSDGYLFLKDTWYPGWRAWVDRQPAPIIRADTYFRAVPLSAGAHTVELRFESETVTWGAVVTGLMIVVWGGVAVWMVRR